MVAAGGGGASAALGLTEGPFRPCRKKVTKVLRQRLGGRAGGFWEGESESISSVLTAPSCHTQLKEGVIKQSKLLSGCRPSLNPETRRPHLNPA